MVSWVEPRRAVRAAMGDEAGNRAGIGSWRVPSTRKEFGVSAADSRESVPQGWQSASGSSSGAKWRKEAGTPLGRPWLAAGD